MDDENIRHNAIMMPQGNQAGPSGLIASIPVTRLSAQLKKTLKSQTVAPSTLATFDDHFRSIMATWPDPFPVHSQAPLDPSLLTAACSLQVVRFFLYRHNLSPACRASDRRDALDRCVAVAQETAHYIQRTLHHPSTSSSQGFFSPSHIANWSARVRTMCPAFFCTHLWRCQLVLCLRGEHGAALALTRVSAAVGDLRKNNIACGRFLAFFLDKLIGRLRMGATLQHLETDEEMLAYTSGDMQGCTDDAWAWNGSESGANLQHSPGQVNDAGGDGLRPELLSTSMLSDREAHDWGGWEHIQRILEQLLQEQQGLTQRPQSQQAADRHTPNPGQYPGPPPLQPSLAPPHAHPPHGSASPYPNSNGGTSSSSRISIKDITSA